MKRKIKIFSSFISIFSILGISFPFYSEIISTNNIKNTNINKSLSKINNLKTGDDNYENILMKNIILSDISKPINLEKASITVDATFKTEAYEVWYNIFGANMGSKISKETNISNNNEVNIGLEWDGLKPKISNNLNFKYSPIWKNDWSYSEAPAGAIRWLESVSGWKDTLINLKYKKELNLIDSKLVSFINYKLGEELENWDGSGNLFNQLNKEFMGNPHAVDDQAYQPLGSHPNYWKHRDYPRINFKTFWWLYSMSIKSNNPVKSILYNDGNILSNFLKFNPIPFSNAGKLWNGATIKPYAENAFLFSDIVTNLKVLATAYDFEEYLLDIVVLATGIRNDKWFDLNVVWNSEFSEESVKNLLSQTKDWQFSDYMEIKKIATEFNKTKGNVDLGFKPWYPSNAKNKYKLKLKEIFRDTWFIFDETIFESKKNFSDLLWNNTNNKDYANIYNLIITAFKLHDISITASYYNESNEIVENPDFIGSKVIKSKIWDSKLSKFNDDWINNFGKKYIDSNFFKIEFQKFNAITNEKYNKIQSRGIIKSEINEWSSNDLKFGSEIMYRYDAINYDGIGIAKWLINNYMDIISIETEKRMSELIYTSNEEEINGSPNNYKHYINDFKTNKNFDIREILLNGLNKSIFGKVLGLADEFGIFNKVYGGIGFGDLKEKLYRGKAILTADKYGKYYHSFFNQKSYQDAFANAGISLLGGKYPAYYPEDNEMLFFTSISSWEYKDGLSNFNNIIKNDLRENRFIYFKENNIDFFLNEIKPLSRSYYDDKGNIKWDNNGYFLVKAKIIYNTDSPNRAWNEYDVINNNEIFNQLQRLYTVISTKIINDDKLFRLSNGLYWENNKKHVIENSFFNTTSYYYDNWGLKFNTIKDFFIDDGISDSLKGIKYIPKNLGDFYNRLSNINKEKFDIYQNKFNEPIYFSAEIFKYYIANKMIKFKFDAKGNDLTKNFTFANANELYINPLFKEILKFNSFNPDEIFNREKIHFRDPETGWSISMDGSYNTLKKDSIFFSERNWVIEENKKTNLYSLKTKDKEYLEVWLPLNLILKLNDMNSPSTSITINNIYNWDPVNPNLVDETITGTSDGQSLKIINGKVNATFGLSILATYGEWNIISNMKKGIRIKKGINSQINTLNVILVTLAPIGIITLIGMIYVILIFFKRQKF